MQADYNRFTNNTVDSRPLADFVSASVFNSLYLSLSLSFCRTTCFALIFTLFRSVKHPWSLKRQQQRATSKPFYNESIHWLFEDHGKEHLQTGNLTISTTSVAHFLARPLSFSLSFPPFPQISLSHRLRSPRKIQYFTLHFYRLQCTQSPSRPQHGKQISGILQLQLLIRSEKPSVLPPIALSLA